MGEAKRRLLTAAEYTRKHIEPEGSLCKTCELVLNHFCSRFDKEANTMGGVLRVTRCSGYRKINNEAGDE